MTRSASSITPLGFTCFCLLAIHGHDPDESPFQPVMLNRTPRRMAALARR